MITIEYDSNRDTYLISINERFLKLKYEIVISLNYLQQLKHEIDRVIENRKKILFTDEDYSNLINPKNLFSSEMEGIEFLKLATCKEDLLAALPHFEKAEFFKCCAFIRNKLI